MRNTDWTLKVLLALLVVGVWGMVLCPLISSTSAQAQGQIPNAVGRYAMMRDSSTTYVLDTTTGTIKEIEITTEGEYTLTKTWDKDYVNSTETKGHISRPAQLAPK